MWLTKLNGYGARGVLYFTLTIVTYQETLKPFGKCVLKLFVEASQISLWWGSYVFKKAIHQNTSKYSMKLDLKTFVLV